MTLIFRQKEQSWRNNHNNSMNRKTLPKMLPTTLHKAKPPHHLSTVWEIGINLWLNCTAQHCKALQTNHTKALVYIF